MLTSNHSSEKSNQTQGKLQLEEPLVKVENLETTFYLNSGPFRAVNNISYDIKKGQTLGIVGESGCGKSVTSFSLMRLIEKPGKITNGKFTLGGKSILDLPENEMENIRGGEMAMIFQEPMTALNPVLTIGYQIDEQVIRHKKCSAKEAKDRSIEMLKLVGILVMRSPKSFNLFSETAVSPRLSSESGKPRPAQTPSSQSAFCGFQENV